MSKYVRKDHPVQQVPIEEIAEMARDLNTSIEDVRWRMAVAYDAGIFDLELPEGTSPK